MSFLDALTILGAGVGQGYRGSQELQRQIVEAKRKALIDERDMAIREQAQASNDALARAQMAGLASETSARDFSTGEARAASLRGASPVTSSGSPRLAIGGNNFQLPNRLDVLQNPEVARLLAQSSDEQFKASHPDYFRSAGSYGSTSTVSAREGRVLTLIQDVLGKPIPALMGEDEDSYMARVSQDRSMKLNFLLNNAATIDSLYKTLGTDATSSDTTKVTRSGSGIVGKGKDRFTGINVKVGG